MISSNSNKKTNLAIDMPNLIPVLDFMLVLLIMFSMLAAPLQNIVKIPLPKINSVPVNRAKNIFPTLYLKSDNSYMFENKKFIDYSHLKIYLARQFHEKKAKGIIIAANKHISLQTMLQVFSLARDVGLKAAQIKVIK